MKIDPKQDIAYMTTVYGLTYLNRYIETIKLMRFDSSMNLVLCIEKPLVADANRRLAEHGLSYVKVIETYGEDVYNDQVLNISKISRLFPDKLICHFDTGCLFKWQYFRMTFYALDDDYFNGHLRVLSYAFTGLHSINKPLCAFMLAKNMPEWFDKSYLKVEHALIDMVDRFDLKNSYDRYSKEGKPCKRVTCEMVLNQPFFEDLDLVFGPLDGKLTIPLLNHYLDDIQ